MERSPQSVGVEAKVLPGDKSSTRNLRGGETESESRNEREVGKTKSIFRLKRTTGDGAT